MKDDLDEIYLIQQRIADLPHGYISRKKINGKERLYLQWREGGRIKSRYIKASETEIIISGIEERRRLENRLRDLTGTLSRSYSISTENGARTLSMVTEAASEYGGSPKYYLKWKDDIIAIINSDLSVRFLPGANALNRRISDILIPDRGYWSRSELVDFLQERIVSRSRRDIENIIARCGLTEYDAVKIGLITHAISARDMLWITDRKDMKLDEALTDVFRSVFTDAKDLTGDSIDTPEGQNIKRYGVSRGRYGIYKERLTPLSCDVESEIAVYLIADKLGVPCCPCWKADDDTVFSAFQYDFASEYIVHFRRLIKSRSYDDELMNLIAVRPAYLDFFVKMIALDFITRQDDRHLSNLAIKISSDSEETYPLYDNGRSLFYEDTEDTALRAYKDIPVFSTGFGPAGSYFDHVKHISDMGISFNKLLDLNISRTEIEDILSEAGFSGYRLEGSEKWIMECINILKELG